MRFLLLLLLAFRLSAQTTTPISGVINHYAAVNAIDTCTGEIQVSNTIGFHPGAIIMVLQAQGAQIATGNTSNYGQVLNIHGAGQYERAEVDSVSATAIFLKNHLLNSYDLVGHVQIISIPQYTDVMVTDTVRAQPWNGQTGGVLALEVSGNLTLNAPLSADGAGFRGGAAYFVTNNNCNVAFPQFSYYYALGTWRSSYKGEGAALPETGKELGRGPQANGGGGGNDHNAGGGGGAHLSDGGRGGDNNEPSALGCPGHFPGIGGYGVVNSPDRLFFGGGGGAGHANNGPTNGGAKGGGIILLKADSVTGLNPVISANGQSAGLADGDGGGGGGAGGTIRLQANAASANLIVRAEGGKGGNTTNINVNRCAGPGGGGSGGRILTNLNTLAPPTGGQPGIITNSTAGCNGSTGGAEAGETGFVQPLSNLPEGVRPVVTPYITLPPIASTVCQGSNASFFVGTNAGSWTYQWQIYLGTTWQDLSNDAIYSGVQSDSLYISGATHSMDSSRYRIVIKNANCSSITSDGAFLTVQLPPTADFTATIDSLSATFNQSSEPATTYLWNFGDGNYSTEASPSHIYNQEGVYAVTLQASNACSTVTTTQTLSLIQLPAANFAVPDSTTDCLSATVTFQNFSSPNVSAYQWTFPGGNPATSTAANPAVTYSNSGNYTAQLIVSNAAGQDTFSRAFVVEIAALPLADFDYQLLPGGVVVFTNHSQQSVVYNWDFGDGSPIVASTNASHQYTQSGTYVVTLSVSNACGGAVLQQNVVVTVEGVGTQLISQVGRVRLFPNPLGEYLTIDCSDAAAFPLGVQVFDANGQLMTQLNKGLLPIMKIPVMVWPGGVYTVAIQFAQDRVVRTVMHK